MVLGGFLTYSRCFKSMISVLVNLCDFAYWTSIPVSGVAREGPWLLELQEKVEIVIQLFYRRSIGSDFLQIFFLCSHLFEEDFHVDKYVAKHVLKESIR